MRWYCSIDNFVTHNVKLIKAYQLTKYLEYCKNIICNFPINNVCLFSNIVNFVSFTSLEFTQSFLINVFHISWHIQSECIKENMKYSLVFWVELACKKWVQFCTLIYNLPPLFGMKWFLPFYILVAF